MQRLVLVLLAFLAVFILIRSIGDVSADTSTSVIIEAATEVSTEIPMEIVR
ncbi:MAG: hypothetical protein FWF68_06495 [Spirochaetes bacterium]|jgi:hypothetical protein|nr:hypothetical protein [Brevinematales bacterium]MCL1959233.1 hypothetical protein [Spirochaetota bacterium]